MDELVKFQRNDLSPHTQRTVSKIMAVCRTLNPQFYKGLSDEEVLVEQRSIEMLYGGIDEEVLNNMCEMAVRKYKVAHSKNPKQHFDSEYILTFYNEVSKEFTNRKWFKEFADIGGACSYSDSKIVIETICDFEDRQDWEFVKEKTEDGRDYWHCVKKSVLSKGGYND